MVTSKQIFLEKNFYFFSQRSEHSTFPLTVTIPILFPPLHFLLSHLAFLKHHPPGVPMTKPLCRTRYNLLSNDEVLSTILCFLCLSSTPKEPLCYIFLNGHNQRPLPVYRSVFLCVCVCQCVVSPCLCQLWVPPSSLHTLLPQLSN